MDTDHPTPAKGDQYEHPDGTTEVVFAVEEGRVLTIREYPDADAFDEGVADASSAGTHEGVANLPDAEFFQGLE